MPSGPNSSSWPTKSVKVMGRTRAANGMESRTASDRLLRLVVGWAVEVDEDEVVVVVAGDIASAGCCRLMPPNVGIGLDSKDVDNDGDDAALDDGCCALGANKGAMRTGDDDALGFDATLLLLLPLVSAFFSSLAVVISSFGKSLSISMWVLGCF